MQKKPSNHFSKKIFFLSLLFLVLNVFFLRFLIWNKVLYTYRSVAPQIHFEEGADVELKSLHSQNYDPAQIKQEWMAGGILRTGEDSTAEIVLENNLIRLNEETELRLVENNFSDYQGYTASAPRLTFELIEGSLWINAFDKIQINTPSAKSYFLHSVGSVVYQQPLNRIMIFSGTADIDLYDLNKQYIAGFSLPLNNQITYTDDQIVSEYGLLQASKLKKELKTAFIPAELSNHPWVLQNIDRDNGYWLSEIEKIEFPSKYWFKNLQLKLRSYITFTPDAKRQVDLQKIELAFGYMLGALFQADEPEKVEQLLKEIEPILNLRSEEEVVQTLFNQALLTVSKSSINTAEYRIKQFLLSYLLQSEGAQILRTYLTDLRREMSSSQLENAQQIIQYWLEGWGQDLIRENKEEFARQSEEIHQIILVYSDRVTAPILMSFDQTGQVLLELHEQAEEVRFNVVEDRLLVAAGLINVFRYPLAKDYLATSYLSLNIDFLPPDLGSTEIFLELGKLLAQRIQYAQERLDFKALAIDELDFKDYLEKKERDENLKELLEIERETIFSSAPAFTLPNPQQLVQEMAAVGIMLSASDISADVENPNEFFIANAQMAQGGKNISFKAKYLPMAKAFRQIEIGDTNLTGAYALKDFALLLSQEYDFESQAERDEPDSLLDLSDFLPSEPNRESRDQLLAENLATQLVFNELDKRGIRVPSVKDIEVLDSFALDNFMIKSAFVDLAERTEGEEFSFEYLSSSQKIKNIILVSTGQLIAETEELEQLKERLITEAEANIRLGKAIEEFEKKVKNKELSFDSLLFSLDSQPGLLNVSFTLPTLNLEIEGVFDTANQTFVSLIHPLYSAQNMELNPYLETLAKFYGADFLVQNGLKIPKSLEWKMKYPFETISVINYVSGDYSFNFTLDFEQNRLTNVSTQGNDSSIPVMTFEEFKEILSE